LIVGPSGSGKTALALTLIDAWRSRAGFARLVADDQVLLSVRHGRLVASAPEAIAGLAEVFGLGPRGMAWLPEAVIDAQCRLVPPGEAPRFSDPAAENLHGLAIPTLQLPARNANASARAIAAWIGDAGPF